MNLSTREVSAKMILTARYLLLLPFLLALNSCMSDYSQCDNDFTPINEEGCLLTVEEARDILDDSMDELSKLSTNYNFSRICLNQEILSVNWAKTVRYYELNSGNDNVESSFLSKYRLQFYVKDRSGRKKLLDSHQRILVVRNRISGGDGSFIMTIVADQSYTNARHTQELGNFHNNGDFSGFSGLVIYTRLSGMIVRADRYLDGERVYCANLQKIQSMADFNGRIRALLKVFGVIRVNRTFSYLDTRCAYGCSPDDSCAHPEDNGYWDNDSTPIPLDSAGYCVADTTDLADPADPDGVFGPGASWGNDWLPDGYWDNNEPDPAPGGGGGSNVGGNRGNNEDDYYHTSISNTDIAVKLGSGLSADDIRLFKEKFNLLAKNEILKKIVEKLDIERMTIVVLSPSVFNSNQSAETKPYSHKTPEGLFIEYTIQINLNPQGDVYGYMEEFFHALQYLTSDRMIQYIGDIEFEAKVLLARIFSNLTKDEQDSLSFSIKSNYEYFEAILKYIDNYGIDSTKNESNRREAINALNHMGYMGFPMTDDGRNLDEILKNYYKVFPKSSK